MQGGTFPAFTSRAVAIRDVDCNNILYYRMDNFKEIVQQKQSEELLRMVYEFKEWSPEMHKAVELELLNRNLLPPDLSEKRNRLIEMEEVTLTKGKTAGVFGKLIGFITIFGLLGIMIGYHYAFAKVKSSYTNKVYFQYDEPTRKLGLFIFYAGIAAAVLFVGITILRTDAVNV